MSVHISIRGLILLCVSLVVATALIFSIERYSPAIGRLARSWSKGDSGPPAEIPAWGELVCQDVMIEQPEEYVGFEATADRVPAWHFDGMGQQQVRMLMLECGLGIAQTEHALAPERATFSPTQTEVHPDEELITSLTPPVRAKFYNALARSGSNRYMSNPYCVSGGSARGFFFESDVDEKTVALVKKLTYENNGYQYFSDVEFVMDRIPDKAGRLSFFKALTRQPAVMARLRMRPTTDVDKILGYWGAVPGVHAKDLRPLMEALKRQEDGGTFSLLYLLPPFARERLYTFALPDDPGKPAHDCHWTAMNFSREQPDDRFSDLGYTSKYIQENYYQVAQPSRYGDLVLVMGQNGALHSAIYIAEDIVFTKNGVNFAQPWILMRMKDVLGAYSFADPVRIVAFRSKSD
jgi:hypothetical protein